MNDLVSVENILRPVWESRSYDLQHQDDALKKIIEKPIFIHPDLKEVKRGKDVNVILISAPGAVGKTTFAKWSAFSKKGYYIDLAKIKLGDNTFIGSLAKYFGPAVLSDVLKYISTGDISFFIDAFDEAEIISGWEGVEKFIREVLSFSKDAKKPNIILFSRSETASILQLLLEEILNEEKISVYEIEYFNEQNSKLFIQTLLEVKGDTNVQKHNQPLKNVCDTIFKFIGKGIDEKCQDIWNNNEIRSFIGYSPVLQTIAEYLLLQNYDKINASFISNTSPHTGLKLISEFIEKLLKREQEKFIEGLKLKLGEEISTQVNWSTVFSPNIQLSIIIYYIIGGIGAVRTLCSAKIPPIIEYEYYESLTQFIPNHPFLRNKEFSSPAFKDYTLASVLQDISNTHSCSIYFDKGNTLTPLFAFFYSRFSEEKCYGSHVGYIYDSVISGQKIEESNVLTYIVKNNNEYILEIINTEAGKSTHFELKCIINSDQPLIIERRLQHAVVSIDQEIVLGRAEKSVELADVEIKAKKIKLKSRECLFNCYYEESSYLEADEFIQEDSALSIKKSGDGIVQVYWPNSNKYPWVGYSLDSPVKTEEEFSEVFYNLKRILVPFRKHGKKEFAKHADFIDNVIVNNSDTRKKLLDYLISVKIIRKDIPTSQYIMDVDALNTYGFSWTDVKSMSNNVAFTNFIRDFMENKGLLK